MKLQFLKFTLKQILVLQLTEYNDGIIKIKKQN